MKYIVANVTKDYWQKARPWLDSIENYALSRGWHLLLFIVDMEFIDKPEKGIQIKRSQIPTYSPGWCKNRKDYVSLEGGEFTELYPFEDDDLIIFMDVDTTMQRPFTKREERIMEQLHRDKIMLAPDSYPKINLFSPDYICTPELDKAIQIRVDDPYYVYNCGVMVGRGSAWKRLYKDFKPHYGMIKQIVPHHAIGQWTINYILQTCRNLEILPPAFHEAPWWTGNDIKEKDGVYYKADQVVCFLHHKFKKEYGYVES